MLFEPATKDEQTNTRLTASFPGQRG